MDPWFLKRVNINVDSGCWEWSKYIDKYGYGRTSHEGKTGVLAHRVSYLRHLGEIPEGMTVDHICFNTSCVNPDHLRILTRVANSENQRSSYATHCSNGHAFTPENTYLRTQQGGGRRQCRKCNAEAQQRYKRRRDERNKRKPVRAA